MTLKGSRKRAKPSPSGGDSPSPTSASNAAQDCPDSQQQSNTSWYPGSWSTISRASKAAPVTEVARESISVAQNVVSTITDSSKSVIDSSRQHRSPSIQLTKKAGASTRSLPLDATTTRVNIASDGTASTTALDKIEGSAATEVPASSKEATGEEAIKPLEKPAEGPQPSTENVGSEQTTVHAGHSGQPTGWLSWIYRPGTSEKAAAGDSQSEVADKPRPKQIPIVENVNQQEAPIGQQEHQEQDQSQADITTETISTAQRRSWLQMWYGSAAKPGEQISVEPSKSLPAEPQIARLEDPIMTPKDPPKEQSKDLSKDQSKDPSHEQGDVAQSTSTKTPAGTAKPSGWSFWAKDGSKNEATGNNPSEAQAVEASMVSNTTARPTSLEPDTEADVNITQKGSVKIKPPKDKSAKDGTVPNIEAISTSTPPEPQSLDATASKQLQRILPNQVLPRFEDTFNLEESPSLLQSLGRLLHYTKGPEHKHVSRVRDPPRVKRALAIGVHGYFPAPFIRNLLGQPTGTSLRFSNMAAEAFRKYTADRGYSCEIETIALEGEGRIAERVDLLWKLLLNWMEQIRKADFIMVACHSQGVPVSIMLVAKLIAFGCINASRVGICAMAGVNMGPFSAFRSRWISGSAGELFDFEIPFSKVSKDYEAALRCVLDHGVRISYIGSIDDQLVSLESALFSPIAHPYIYRSVFVDGRVHAPSFLSHLVGFALKLRNLGLQDHGLIRELSSPLAGSLYTGDGHSRLYDDEAVYYMAIQFALETNSIPDAQLNVKRSSPAISPNPYILPFAMRGLLEEEYVRRELHEETMELLKQFDDWKPSSKVLKDVKFRLEGIRSKL